MISKSLGFTQLKKGMGNSFTFEQGGHAVRQITLADGVHAQAGQWMRQMNGAVFAPVDVSAVRRRTVPLLTEEARQRRLDWAREHEDDDWGASPGATAVRIFQDEKCSSNTR